MISFAISILTTITTQFLPKPGAYLPKVINEEVSEDEYSKSEFTAQFSKLTSKKSDKTFIDTIRTSKAILNEFEQADKAPFSMFTLHQMAFT